MKKTALTVMCALALCALLLVGICAAGSTEPLVLIPNENGEEIGIAPVDGVFYLPSSVDIQRVGFDPDPAMSYSGNQISGTLGSGEALDLTPFETVDERGEKCYRLKLSAGGWMKEYTFYHDDTLSTVFVSTSLGLSQIDKSKSTRDKGARITILDSDGAAEYCDLAADTKSEIKGRGNATFTYLKKPYQIKLSAKTDLFGMGASKTWILLANYTDQSMLHNALGFMLGDALNVPYNIDYRFVNLYIDGEYRGLYMLCEKVQIGESRVDIADLEKATENANPDIKLDDARISTVQSGALIENSILTKYTYCEGVASPSDITGGYLVELDFRGEQEPCHFTTENGMIYVVKSPEYASREEVEYIAGLFADMEEAIYSETGYNRKGIHYSEYMDMESFASVYVVQELMKNWDAYLGSMFFFKDADAGEQPAKIYMGPLWDLDNTLGNINFNYEFGQDTAYLWAQDGVFQDYVRTFAKSLMKHDGFKDEVAAQYTEAYIAVRDALAEDGWFASSAAEIRAGVAMDRTRWCLYDSDSWLLSQYGYKSSVKFVQFEDYGSPDDQTTDTALGFMRYFLSARADALLYSIGTGEVPPVRPPEESTSDTSAAPETSAQTGAGEKGDENDTKPAVEPIAVIAVFAIATGAVGVGAALIFKKKK